MSWWILMDRKALPRHGTRENNSDSPSADAMELRRQSSLRPKTPPWIPMRVRQRKRNIKERNAVKSVSPASHTPSRCSFASVVFTIRVLDRDSPFVRVDIDIFVSGGIRPRRIRSPFPYHFFFEDFSGRRIYKKRKLEVEIASNWTPRFRGNGRGVRGCAGSVRVSH